MQGQLDPQRPQRLRFLIRMLHFCLTVRSFLILDFSYCPLSPVLHVTLANLKRFGFEFYPRSSSAAFSWYDDQSGDQLITSLLATPR